jgi:predicted SprT family Zn-dependent metalloprotease
MFPRIMLDAYWKSQGMIKELLAKTHKAMPAQKHLPNNSMANVLTLLSIEFDQLNTTHFGSRLKTPTMEFSTRKSYGGYYQKNRHRIVLSWQAYQEHGIDETLNTFRHEIAHIVHQNHRREFWELAVQLGVTHKYAAAPIAAVRRRSRWYTYECPSCQGAVQRRRRILSNSSCSKCDNKYNPAYRLTLVKSELH